MAKSFKRRAFTLIEISIVLVIIGIILASVMKGRDMIKSSQIKEYNQVFVSQWETISNSYFSRMAENLDDNNSDGFSDGNDLSTATNAKAVVDALKEAGIDPCNLVKSDVKSTGEFGCATDGLDVFKRTVDGEFIGKSTTQAKFSYMTIDSKKKNVIIFYNVPHDVAQAIDTIRDGMPDGTSGSVLNVTNVSSASATSTAATTADWSGADTTDANGADMVLLLDH